ncbi:MAG: hypothetical protein M1837_003387 [Sclerophora amabilis]|nr:MAG: hypothetical protein M1837_003387 [Sclerophora amabilis]
MSASARGNLQSLKLPVWFNIATVKGINDTSLVLTVQFFRSTGELYAMTIAGETVYIVTAPKDIAAVYRKTASLTFDDFIRETMISFHVSPSTTIKMYQVPDQKVDHLKLNPLQKCLAHLVRDFHKEQLHPGEKMDVLANQFVHHIDESLRWEKVCERFYPDPDGRERSELSLLDWCKDIHLDAGTKAFFSEKLLSIDPTLFDHFVIFDNTSWKLMYRLPRVFAKDMHFAEKRLVEAFTTYFRLHKEQKVGQAWFVDAFEAQQRQLGIDDVDIARSMLMVYWVVNSNAYKLSFWILAYVLQDRELISSLRAETAQALQNDVVDMKYLLNLCPLLNATFDEGMRLTTLSSSSRCVTSPTAIGGKTLRSGAKVLIPYRQLHFSEEIFGEDIEGFHPDRFLKKEGLSGSPSYKPFGGGSTYCPGRFIARQEILACVALMINRFNIELSTDGDSLHKGHSPQRFPLADGRKPSLGVMDPMNGHDLTVRVTRNSSLMTERKAS